MGFLDVWEILEEMITRYRKEGAKVPEKIMEKLKFSKTLIKVLEMDPDKKETRNKIENHLLNVQSYLISKGQTYFGEKYVGDLLQRLNEAERKPFECKEEGDIIFGMPRKRKWIRVKTSSNLPMEELKVLAEELNLSYDPRDEGHLLVYGEGEDVTNFCKKIIYKYGPKFKENFQKKSEKKYIL